MGYPFRIVRPAAIKAQGATLGAPLQEYLGRVIKLIPAEVVALYTSVRGVIEGATAADASARAALLWLPIIGVLLVIFVRAWGTRDASKAWSTVQWIAVIVAAISFIVWVIALGHPIWGVPLLAAWIGSVALFVWAFLVPYFYEGS